MKNSTTKISDTVTKRLEIGQIGIKNSLKIIVTGALLLASTSAMAGLLSSPMGVVHTNLELAPSTVQHVGNDIVRIQTTGLTGEFKLDCSDLLPDDEVPATSNGVLTFDQELNLVIDIGDGTVSGHSVTNLVDASSPLLVATAEVRGNATCLSHNGRECGQLVVDLEARGVLSDPNNPSAVGRIQTEMLGSMIFDFPTFAHWVVMPTSTTIGGNEVLINSALEYAACRGAL